MKYVMGIDQGGSKTHVLVGDAEGHILGIGRSYGACHSSSGMQVAMEAVRQAAQEALAQANLGGGQLSAIAAGMTGADWPDEPVLLQSALQDLFKVEKTVVVNDCLIALRAENSSGCGAVLCAGSGLNCGVKKDDGTQVVFGFYVEDAYQGGGALARMSLQAVMDGQAGLAPATALTGILLSYFGLSDVDALLRRQVEGGISTDQLLHLPMLLEEAALAGDAVALEIWADYGTSIARYPVAGLQKLDMLNAPIDVVLSGSIFKCRVPALREAVSLGVHRRAVHARIVDAKYEPVVGALLLALDQLHEVIPEVVNRNLVSDTEQFLVIR